MPAVQFYFSLPEQQDYSLSSQVSSPRKSPLSQQRFPSLFQFDPVLRYKIAKTFLAEKVAVPIDVGGESAEYFS